MNLPTENILQSLFKTTSLQNVSAEQLLQIIKDHPYNGVAFFLLAKKLYHSKETGYEDALQKAAIHFPNDLWLNYILTEEIETVDVTNHLQIKEAVIEKEVNEFDNIHLPETNEAIKEERTVEENNKAINDFDNIQTTDLIREEELSDKETLAEDYIETDIPVNEKLSNMLQEQAAAFEEPIEADVEIPVENTPYHRVDYFDSQGIKLEEEKTNDKLGTQLKRFTEWLKQMKSINQNPAELVSDEAGETQVQTIAAHSNEAGEIVTETMAEVLIKQGKPEQAIQIYQKLSFNNPAKSAYFAAKIQELKG